MFVLHCVLLNIAAYLREQMTKAVAAWSSFARNSQPDHTTAGKQIKSTYERSSSRRSRSRSRTRSTPGRAPKKAPTGLGGALGGANAACGDWPEDAVPSTVRSQVYASDEQVLLRVAGLARVRREANVVRVMCLDSTGRRSRLRSAKVRGARVRIRGASLQRGHRCLVRCDRYP